MTVDHTLGVAGRAGRERDERGRAGVGLDDAGQGFCGKQFLEVPTDDADHGHVDIQVRLVPEVPEALGGDDDARLRGREDVADLLRAVEVHDRDHDSTENGGRPEGRGRLHPVRQLEDDDVTGADAAFAQSRGEPAGEILDLADGARPRPDGRVHLELHLAAGRPSAGQQITDGIPCPPTVLLVALDQTGGDLAHVSCSPPPGISVMGRLAGTCPPGGYGTRPRVGVRERRRAPRCERFLDTFEVCHASYESIKRLITRSLEPSGKRVEVARSLEERVQALEDRDAIAEMQARYVNYNDGGWTGPTHQHPKAVAALFTAGRHLGGPLQPGARRGCRGDRGAVHPVPGRARSSSTT